MVLIAFLVAVAVRVICWICDGISGEDNGSENHCFYANGSVILSSASVSSACNRNRSEWNSIQSCKRLRILACQSLCLEVDEKTNLKTWTVMETIVGLVGAVGATIAWFIVS